MDKIEYNGEIYMRRSSKWFDSRNLVVYSRYEREEREPDIDALCKLADYFNVTVDYILCRTDKKD